MVMVENEINILRVIRSIDGKMSVDRVGEGERYPVSQN